MHNILCRSSDRCSSSFIRNQCLQGSLVCSVEQAYLLVPNMVAYCFSCSIIYYQCLSSGSAVTAAATAFALSLYSQLLQHCTQSIDLWKKLLEQGRAPRGLVSLPCEHKETKDDSLKRNKPGQDRSDSEEETVQQGPRRRGKRRAASSRRRRHAMAESDSEEEEDETVRVEEVSEDDLSEGGGDFESDEVSPELSDLSDYEDSKAQETKSSDRDGGVKVQAKRPLAIRFPGMSEIQDHCEGTTSNTQGANFHNEVPGSDVHEQGCVPSDVHGKGSVNQDSNEKTQLDPTTAVLLRWLSCHHFLPSVKVVFDWLRIHPAIVASCTQVSKRVKSCCI